MALYNVAFLFLPFLGILRISEAAIAYNPKCSLGMRKGAAYCKELGQGEVSCELFCANYRAGVYHCSQDRGWDRQLPACLSDFKALPSCVLTVGNGKVVCAEEGGKGIGCVMHCDGKFRGLYHCSNDRGWSKTLPDCVAGVKVNSRCSLAVRNGSVVCQDIGRGEISCTVLCESGPTHGFYRCSQDQGWNRELPPCVSEFRDSMCNLNVKSGTASCQVEGTGEIVCNVLCDRRFQGVYRCVEGRGWDKRLPPCVN
ncbi:unnamed protein product [Larinioides sclopetarius]|uniref:Uncharacterized protein n=1 Tax=Larinioides sclopetarius TaxID=280406 RepID=A0AAV2ATR2_9ARAC